MPGSGSVECLPVVLNKQPRDTTVPVGSSHLVAMRTVNVISVELLPTLPTLSAQLDRLLDGYQRRLCSVQSVFHWERQFFDCRANNDDFSWLRVGVFPPGKFNKYNGFSGPDVKIFVHQLGHKFTSLSRPLQSVDISFWTLGIFEQQTSALWKLCCTQSTIDQGLKFLIRCILEVFFEMHQNGNIGIEGLRRE